MKPRFGASGPRRLEVDCSSLLRSNGEHGQHCTAVRDQDDGSDGSAGLTGDERWEQWIKEGRKHAGTRGVRLQSGI